jgi:hypothetical protein
MINRFVMAVAAAGICAATVGCGSPAGLVPVSGKVLYRGEPAAGAVVYFHQEGNAGGPQLPVPVGIVQDDGTFFLASDTLGNGARPGRYSVFVEWKDMSGDGTAPVKTRGTVKLVKRSRVRSGPDRLGGRYFDVGKPLLHAEVKPGSNQLAPFELTD